MVSSLVCSTREIKGVPIFPARIVKKPAAFKMCSIKEVVVVFPFEPVIPIKRPSRKRSASSTSLQMVTPFARAACSKGASAGTPGLGTIRSCPRNTFSRWPPSSSLMPGARSGAIASPISFSVRASVAVTFAPRAAQKSAVARPVLASPTTSTRLPRNSNGFGINLAKFFNRSASLPQLQRGQRKQRKNQRGDPKPHDHLAADHQAIKPVRQVHGVGRTHNDDGGGHKKGQKRERPEVPGKMRLTEQRVNHQIGMKSLQKGKDELRRVGAVGGQNKKNDADDQADENLEINFLLRRETQIALLRDFRIVIDEANDGKTEQRE